MTQEAERIDWPIESPVCNALKSCKVDVWVISPASETSPPMSGCVTKSALSGAIMFKARRITFLVGEHIRGCCVFCALVDARRDRHSDPRTDQSRLESVRSADGDAVLTGALP